MNKKIIFSFNEGSKTAKIVDSKTGKDLVLLNRKTAMWLAERIMKQFGFELK